MNNVGTWWLWTGFGVFVVVAFCLDILFQSRRRAVLWTCIWISAALLFNILLWIILYCTQSLAIADEAGINFFTGYVIEKSLSIDNLFAFFLIFSQLQIPAHLQHRVFSYGILSAVILRLGLILVGSALVTRFHWVLYLMGVFLVLMGIKLLWDAHKPIQPLKSTRLFKWLERHFRLTSTIKDQRFFTMKNGVRYATPLFIALILIELNDLVFALDSIPAIFAITTDPFIVWTSNVFAILGLRALYFVLADVTTQFHLLKYGIALLIVYVGVKILISAWIVIPVTISLLIIAGILTFFILLSRALRK